MTDQPTFSGFVCPLPLRDYPQIVLGHGSGGRLSADLIQHLFVPLFDNPALAALNDQAVVDINGARLAFTTDSYVISPLFFPGEMIAACRARHDQRPGTWGAAAFLALYPAEGLPMDDLGRIATSMAQARAAGVVGARIPKRQQGQGRLLHQHAGLVWKAAWRKTSPTAPAPATRSRSAAQSAITAWRSCRREAEPRRLVSDECHGCIDAGRHYAVVTSDIHLRATRGGLALSTSFSRAMRLASPSRDGDPVRPAVMAACDVGIDRHV